MINVKQLVKFISQPLPAYILLSLVYVVLIFTLPVNKTTAGTLAISSLEYKAVLLAIALPSVVVWSVAFFGYARLKQYASSIRKTTEGPNFEQLARGCTWLAWSLPVSAVILLLLSAIANKWPHFQSTTVILGNYISLILPLVAFILIGSASRGLMTDAKLRLSHASSRGIMLIFIAAGTLYCYMTFRQFDLSSLGNTNNLYFLPLWLVILTIIVPYLYAWFVGLLTAYEISTYNKNVRGVLYRQALYLLVVGLVVVIISSVSTQYMNGLQPRIDHLVLDYKLPLMTIFRITGGVGFLLIAIGAIRLKKIEEV